MTKRIAFLGAGNMAGAIIEGMLSQHYPATHITTTNRSREQQQHWQARGLHAVHCNIEAVKQADIVIVGVKPVGVNDLLNQIAPHTKEDAVVVSLAAGVPIANFEHFLPKHAIIRTMPNTPTQVQQGVTGVFANHNCTTKQTELVVNLFAPLGLVHKCRDESDIDRVIAVAGSAPAYFFLFMESMINASIAQGMNEEDAKAMTYQSALGAATMAQKSGIDAAELRRRVTSPGGTTEQAILHFQEAGLESTVKEAMDKCRSRAIDMAAQLKVSK